MTCIDRSRLSGQAILKTLTEHVFSTYSIYPTLVIWRFYWGKRKCAVSSQSHDIIDLLTATPLCLCLVWRWKLGFTFDSITFELIASHHQHHSRASVCSSLCLTAVQSGSVTGADSLLVLLKDLKIPKLIWEFIKAGTVINDELCLSRVFLLSTPKLLLLSGLKCFFNTCADRQLSLNESWLQEKLSLKGCGQE